MEQKIKHKKMTWYHFDENTEEVGAHLQENFGFHELDIEDVTAGPQQPKVDLYKDYLFAIFHFPDFQTDERRIHVHELDIFLGKDYVITVSKGQSKRLVDMFTNLENDKAVRDELMGEGAAFFMYELIDALTESCWPVVRKLSTQIGDIEEEIYSEDTHKGTVWEIALIRRNLIRLKRILNPQQVVLGTLVHTDKAYLPKDLSVYFDDIQDTYNRMQAIIGGYFDAMNTLHNVNESLISQRTNEVIKLLTVISVALLPMTLLTGFYGMNVEELPFIHEPHFVWGIFGVLFFIIVVFLGISRKRDWL